MIEIYQMTYTTGQAGILEDSPVFENSLLKVSDKPGISVNLKDVFNTIPIL